MKKVFINVDSQGHLIEPGDTIIWIADPSRWRRFQRVGRVVSNWDPNSKTITALASNSAYGRISRLKVYYIAKKQYDPELGMYYNPSSPAMNAYMNRWAKARKTPWYNSSRSEDWFEVRVWPRIVTLKDKF